ncbi:MAG: EAL domain-containing protein [Leptospiraceae bacterium]|nr:EAL domain-containing protein [Leptospiraceae bacterium]
MEQDLPEFLKGDEPCCADIIEFYLEMFRRNTAPKLLIDPEDGVIVDANAAACQFYGYSLSEFRKLTVADLNLLPAEEVRAEMRRAREEERRYFEFQHRLASGEVRFVQVYSGPILIRGRHLLHSIIHDYTEPLKHRQTLEEYKHIFEQLPVGVYRNEAGREGKFLEVNPAMARILGAESVDELLKHEASDFYDGKQERAAFSEELQQKGIIRREIQLRTLRGDHIWALVTASRYLLDNGKTVFNGVLEDITAQKIAERDLRQAVTVFENTQEGIVITDANVRIQAVNRAFTRITGYTEQEVIGKNPSMLSSGFHDESFFAGMWSALAEEGFWSGEIWNRRKDGSVYPELATISQVLDGHGHVSQYVAIFTDISRIKDYQHELEKLAHSDPLTGLANRLLFHERLNQAMSTARRNGERLAILFLDLDNFKDVNDSLGHPVGDQVLREAARRLLEVSNEDQTVARFGGDEFLYLVPRIESSGEVALVADQVARTLGEPYRIGDRNLNITVSLGLTIFPDHAASADEMIQQADTAMYRAKKDGLRYRFYSQELTDDATRRVRLASELRRGLEREEFQLNFQPQVSLANGELIGLEALVRWKHPSEGMISPDSFIPLAETMGLIIPLGEWVLRNACMQAKLWLDKGIHFRRVAVNVSPQQLQSGDFANRVFAILQETGLSASHLEIEITENSLMDLAESIVEQLHSLRAEGVAVAIDDFGVGYSSLSYLKDLPVDRLKIDRSFVSALPHDQSLNAISRAIIGLGKNLGFEVIAEGIELEEQRRHLLHEGCEQGQGFLFGRPVPAESLVFQKNGEMPGNS